MNKRKTGEVVTFKSKGVVYTGEIVSIPQSLYGIYHVGVKYDEMPRFHDSSYRELAGQPWRFFTISEEEIVKGVSMVEASKAIETNLRRLVGLEDE